jgi:hypothetical protein
MSRSRMRGQRRPPARKCAASKEDEADRRLVRASCAIVKNEADRFKAAPQVAQRTDGRPTTALLWCIERVSTDRRPAQCGGLRPPLSGCTAERYP